MRKHLLGLMLFSAIATAPSQAKAWDAEGHRIVASIADRNLTPEAKKEVSKLLDLVGERDMVSASVWADKVKSKRKRDDFYFSRAFSYVYFDPENEASGESMGRVCAENGCVVMAIAHYYDVLTSKSATNAAKAEALKFLINFVGDIHQPLNAGRKKDKGGTKIKVKFFGKRVTLFEVWDALVISSEMKKNPGYGGKLATAITDEERTKWAGGNAVDWAIESNAAAEAAAYQGVKRGTKLGDAYVAKARPVIERRLKQAGLRLADLLNEAFASDDGSASEPAPAAKPEPTPAPAPAPAPAPSAS